MITTSGRHHASPQRDSSNGSVAKILAIRQLLPVVQGGFEPRWTLHRSDIAGRSIDWVELCFLNGDGVTPVRCALRPVMDVAAPSELEFLC
jgi:hypothetical protein